MAVAGEAAGEGDPATFARRLATRAKRIVTTCGSGRMVWHQWGDDTAMPLVLLHGGSGSWTHWIRNVEQLSEKYCVLAADTPGLGDSDMPPERLQGNDYPAFMAALAKLVDDGIRDIVGEAPFHLCGFSMGSIFGTYLAAAAEARVKSLTLVGAAAFGLEWSGVVEKLEPMTVAMDAATRRALQRRNLKRIMTWRDADELAGYLQLDNVERARVRSHGVAHTDTLARALVRVRAPLRGIWGCQDIYAMENFAEIEVILRARDPNARFTLIDNAGHWVMYEAPEAFNSALVAGL
ncbi:MAG: alpha/beta fold hydrolase [Rhodospirillaceae bacterium]